MNRFARRVLTDVFGYGWQPDRPPTPNDERLRSVANYLRLSWLCHRRILDALGDRDDLTADRYGRASALINQDLVDQLAAPALEAILAARALDSELAARLKEAQSAVLALLGLFNICKPECSVAPLLNQLSTISAKNQYVSDRIQEMRLRSADALPEVATRPLPVDPPQAGSI